jgi:hypothetical protein
MIARLCWRSYLRRMSFLPAVSQAASTRLHAAASSARHLQVASQATGRKRSRRDGKYRNTSACDSVAADALHADWANGGDMPSTAAVAGYAYHSQATPSAVGVTEANTATKRPRGRPRRRMLADAPAPDHAESEAGAPSPQPATIQLVEAAQAPAAGAAGEFARPKRRREGGKVRTRLAAWSLEGTGEERRPLEADWQLPASSLSTSPNVSSMLQSLLLSRRAGGQGMDSDPADWQRISDCSGVGATRSACTCLHMLRGFHPGC